MLRRSSVSAPGTVSTRHVRPPSVVRATRPRVPLAHTTVGLEATKPRNSAFVFDCCGSHCAWLTPGVNARITSDETLMWVAPAEISARLQRDTDLTETDGSNLKKRDAMCQGDSLL